MVNSIIHSVPVPLLARQGSTVFFIVFLIFSAWSAFRIGISGIYDAMAKLEIDQWSKASEKIAGGGNRVKSYLSISYLFEPSNPSASINLGRLYEFRALSESRKANLRSALHHYTLASELRPASSVTWAIIAEVKSQLAELDMEFEEALAQSVRFGPWEPVAQILIVRVGLRNWAQLSGQTRKLIRDTAIRGMFSRASGQSRRMARLLENQGFLTLVCPHLPNSGEFSRYCKNTINNAISYQGI